MESKAWSDQESDDNESKSEERSSERRPPVLPLGTIYERVTGAPEPVEREHERTEPEVAQSIIPGMPELSLGAPQAEEHIIPPPVVAEEAPLPQPSTEALPDDEDDDDSEESDENAEPPTKQVVAPLPVAVEDIAPATTLSQDIEQAVQQPVIPAEQPAVPDVHEPLPVAVAETPVVEPATITPPESVVPPAVTYPSQPPIERAAVPVQPLEEQPPYPPLSGAGGGQQPPRPPMPPGGAAGSPDYPGPTERRWPDEGMSAYAAMGQPGLASYNTYPSFAQQQYGGDMVTRREFDRSMAESRRGRLARDLTLLALGWYLGHRKVKPLREQVQALQKENVAQTDRITTLEGQQHTTQQAIERQAAAVRQTYEQPYRQAAPTPFETASGPVSVTATPGVEAPRRPTPPVAPAGQENVPRIIGGDGQEIVLQEGQHFEVSAGGYGAVLDERNRVVEDAIQYGESFQQDRLPERMPTPFGTQDARFKDAGGIVTGSGGGGGGGGVPQATLSSGQVPQDHTLSAGPAAGRFPSEEAQHLLEAPKANPVVAAITSPWLWLGVGILMIAFFAAATI